MRTRSGRVFGTLGSTRSGLVRTAKKNNARKTLAASSPAAGALPAAGAHPAASTAIVVHRPVGITLVPSVLLTRAGTVRPFIGREPWLVEREVDGVRVCVGRDWTVTPWEDIPGKTSFVGRFDANGTSNVLHVDDDRLSVETLFSRLNKALGMRVLRLETPSIARVDPSMSLAELAAREGRRSFTLDYMLELKFSYVFSLENP